MNMIRWYITGVGLLFSIGFFIASWPRVEADPEEMEHVQIAMQDTAVHWYDDVQADVVSIFKRSDTPVLPATPSCDWVKKHPDKAKPIIAENLRSGVGLGNAVLAGYLEMKESLPDLINGWVEIEEEAYNGESPTDSVELSLFRELQGVAYVIEHLSGKTIKEAVTLTEAQRSRLLAKSADGIGSAAAILQVLGN
jgi:hypothetical protein